MTPGDLSATVVTASEVSPGAHLRPEDTTTATKSHHGPGSRELPGAGTKARAPPAARETAGSCECPHLESSLPWFHIWFSPPTTKSTPGEGTATHGSQAFLLAALISKLAANKEEISLLVLPALSTQHLRKSEGNFLRFAGCVLTPGCKILPRVYPPAEAVSQLLLQPPRTPRFSRGSSAQLWEQL